MNLYDVKRAISTPECNLADATPLDPSDLANQNTVRSGIVVISNHYDSPPSRVADRLLTHRLYIHPYI